MSQDSISLTNEEMMSSSTPVVDTRGADEAANEGPSQVRHFKRTDSSTSSQDSTNNGRWTAHEHEQFLAGYDKYGKDWKRISEFMGTRTNIQCRTHAQKFFKKRGFSEAFQDGSVGTKRVQEDSDDESSTSEPPPVHRTTNKRTSSSPHDNVVLSTRPEPMGITQPFTTYPISTPSGMMLPNGAARTAAPFSVLPATGQSFRNFAEALAPQRLFPVQQPLLDLLQRQQQQPQRMMLPSLQQPYHTTAPSMFQPSPVMTLGASPFTPAPFMRFPLSAGLPGFFKC